MRGSSRKVRDFALVLAEFHQASVGLFLQVLRSGSPALERFDASSCGVICEWDKNALGCPFQDRSQDSSRGTPLAASLQVERHLLTATC